MHGINIDNSVVILDEAHNIVSELYVSDLFCWWEREGGREQGEGRRVGGREGGRKKGRERERERRGEGGREGGGGRKRGGRREGGRKGEVGGGEWEKRMCNRKEVCSVS